MQPRILTHAAETLADQVIKQIVEYLRDLKPDYNDIRYVDTLVALEDNIRGGIYHAVAEIVRQRVAAATTQAAAYRDELDDLQSTPEPGSEWGDVCRCTHCALQDDGPVRDPDARMGGTVAIGSTCACGAEATAVIYSEVWGDVDKCRPCATKLLAQLRGVD